MKKVIIGLVALALASCGTVQLSGQPQVASKKEAKSELCSAAEKYRSNIVREVTAKPNAENAEFKLDVLDCREFAHGIGRAILFMSLSSDGRLIKISEAHVFLAFDGDSWQVVDQRIIYMLDMTTGALNWLSVGGIPSKDGVEI